MTIRAVFLLEKFVTAGCDYTECSGVLLTEDALPINREVSLTTFGQTAEYVGGCKPGDVLHITGRLFEAEDLLRAHAAELLLTARYEPGPEPDVIGWRQPNGAIMRRRSHPARVA